MVLKPVFDIVGQIVMALISLLSQLLIALFRVHSCPGQKSWLNRSEPVL